MATTAVSMDPPGLGPKKTFFIMVTVIGCIAILWPKVFYPMMFGGQPKTLIKDHRGSSGCCDVVLDQQTFANITQAIKQPGFRKRLNLITGEISLRQERPPHLRPDAIHPAMRERGRAIPTTTTVPIIIEKPHVPPVVPRVVEGRPGPLPGMRPPMGGGAIHQANQKGNSMGFVMPLYTIGIVAFFVFTIMKLIFKKPQGNTPYAEPTKPNPEFTKHVFGQDNANYKKTEGNGSNLVGWKEHDTIVTAIQGLIDAADEQLNKRENYMGLSKNATEANGHLSATISNGHVSSDVKEKEILKDEAKKVIGEFIKKEQSKENEANNVEPRQRDVSNDRSVKILGMEMTTSCEGGKKWHRPTEILQHNEHDSHPEAQSIFLEGCLPHESQILVADSETTTERIINTDINGADEEPAVVLSSKMTLSLINLDPFDKNKIRPDDEEVEEEEEEEEEEAEEEIEYEEEEEDEEEAVEEVVQKAKEIPKQSAINDIKVKKLEDETEDVEADESEAEEVEAEESEAEEIEAEESEAEEIEAEDVAKDEVVVAKAEKKQEEEEVETEEVETEEVEVEEEVVEVEEEEVEEEEEEEVAEADAIDGEEEEEEDSGEDVEDEEDEEDAVELK